MWKAALIMVPEAGLGFFILDVAFDWLLLSMVQDGSCRLLHPWPLLHLLQPHSCPCLQSVDIWWSTYLGLFTLETWDLRLDLIVLCQKKYCECMINDWICSLFRFSEHSKHSKYTVIWNLHLLMKFGCIYLAYSFFSEALRRMQMMWILVCIVYTSTPTWILILAKISNWILADYKCLMSNFKDK